jgi:hypothetical protein
MHHVEIEYFNFNINTNKEDTVPHKPPLILR